MKNRVKTTCLAITMAVTSGVAMAHSDDLTCNADFAYNIDIQDQDLAFSSQDQQRVLITANNELYLDGKKQQLSAEQKTVLDDYNKKVRQLLPMAADVAEEASSIAIDVVANVTAVLMQDNPDKAEEFKARVAKISDGLKQHISATYLRPEGMVAYLESSDFESEFEVLIESAVKEFMQNNIGEMVAAAMSGNEDKVKAFEKRMEQFGRDMEEEFEARGEKLEKQAEELCQLVQSIDLKEADLVQSFGQFKNYQLITD